MPTFSATVLNPRDISASGVSVHVTWYSVSVFASYRRRQHFNMRIRIQLFTYMRIRILLLNNQWHESATTGLQTLQGSILSLHGSMSFYNSWTLTSMRIRIQLFSLMRSRIRISFQNLMRTWIRNPDRRYIRELKDRQQQSESSPFENCSAEHIG